jgi:hypothetical protein
LVRVYFIQRVRKGNLLSGKILEEIKNMKKYASFYSVSLMSVALAAVLGVPWNSAMAQGTPAPAVVTPQAAPAAAAAPEAPPLPFGVSEVLKMYQGGISKEVIVSYIENTVLPFHLTADGIIYLQHLGVPQEITAALIRRDGELVRQAAANYQQAQAMAYQQQQQQAPPPAGNYQTAPAQPQTVVTPGTAAPAISPYGDVSAAPPVVYPDYDVYPYYGYPYYYGPNVVIGGFGWGWGGRGFGWGGRGGFGGHGGFGGGHGGFGGHR